MSADRVKPTILGMRNLLLVAAVLVFFVGTTLTLQTENTGQFFAWTIAPPANLYLTAAFLGASYWASGILELLGSREKRWSHSRITVPSVLLFTFLTLIVTLIHINRFHLGPPLGQPAEPLTVYLTYFWLLVYIAVPVVLGVLLVMQLRVPGGDPPRAHPLALWMRALLGVQAAVMLVIGVCLLFFPQTAPSVWPWKLTPLTAQAIGAWLVSLPVAGFQSIWENDYRRIRPAMVSYAVLGLLQLAAVLRYPGDLPLAAPAGWLYVIFLVSVVVVGVNGILGARRPALTTAERT